MEPSRVRPFVAAMFVVLAWSLLGGMARAANGPVFPSPPGRLRLHPTLIYAANGSAGAITAYASDGAHVVPLASISGPHTGLANPVGLTFDSSGYLYVVNHGTQTSVTVYAPFAHGDAAPVRTLAGANTKLTDAKVSLMIPNASGPIGVDLATGHLFVSVVSTNTTPPLNDNVLVFPANAHGNVAPTTSVGDQNEVVQRTNGPAELTAAPGIAISPLGDLIGTELYDCCHGSDGWVSYVGAGLMQAGGFDYYENGGVNGLAAAPNGNFAILYGVQSSASSPGVAASLDVWPPTATQGGSSPYGTESPLYSFTDPLGVGFVSVAFDPFGTVWALSGGHAIEGFVSLPPHAHTVVQGVPAGTSAIAIPPCPLSPVCPRNSGFPPLPFRGALRR